MCVRHSRGRLRAALVFSVVLFTTPVSAHEGPPFPIVQDKPVGPAVISIWTDPDVGNATFFVLVNPPAGGVLPNDLKVRLGVQPKSGRLAEANYEMQRENLSGQVQYKAVPYLDQQELWRVRVTLVSAAGGGELISEVEATPPGYGRWDLLIYLLPFLAVGLLWMRAVLRRRRA